MFSIKLTYIRYSALVLIIVLFGGAFWYIQKAQGVTRTWDGGGADVNWNTAANWSGDTVPTSSDVASFDGTCVSNCSPTVNVSLSGATAPAGINMASDYTGTITQSGTNTITVGASNWVQAGGTFTGGSGAITINGNFTLSGGTFTSTTGTLTVGWPSSASETFFTISGGTFNHNNGTVKFSPSANSCCNFTKTIDVMTSLTLYNVETIGNNNISNLTLATGDTIIVANNFTQSYAPLGGTWEVQGNVTIGASAIGGYGTITMTGTGTKTYTYTSGGLGPYLRINNSSLSVVANTGTTNLNVSYFSLMAGTFTAPTGTLAVGWPSSASETFFTISGGTFNHNNGTVKFSPSANSCCNFTKTIDVMTSLTLYNVETIGNNNISNLTLATGDTIIVANNFTQSYAPLGGTWEVQGNVTIGASALGGTALLNLTGSNNQTYTDSGGNEVDGDITINKTAGIVSLLSNADWNASGQDLTITAGTLKSGNTYALSTTALTVGASGVLKMVGTGDLTLAGNVANSGQIIIESNQTCGGTDDIQILSSVAGTQRAWSGAGTVTVYDATIKDQGGTAAITAYSSTSVSGNGANWTFSGAACPSIAPALNITSGLLNIGTGIVNFR